MKRLISIGEAEKLAKDFIEEDDDKSLYELVENILSQETIIGSVDEFHNFAVDFSRKDDYDTACKILDKGLESFPKSVDLLADYLQYGINCGRFVLCDTYFHILEKIPMVRWTWRGFSFSIDYLQFLADGTDNEVELNEWKQKMIELANKYLEYMPYNEDAFLTKANVFKYFNDTNQEIIVLETALKNIKSCPKCALRLADIFFNRGEYKKSLEYIDVCRYSATQTQEKINQAYMYYLSGLCKSATVHQEKMYDNKDLIIDIYQDFCIADKLHLGVSSYKKVMERQINILETKTKISYDESNF